MNNHAIRFVTYKGKKTEVIIDQEDRSWFDQYTWTASDNGCGTVYVHRRTRKHEGGKPRKIYLHRALIRAGSGQIVDHINRNSLDNRKANLRIASSAVNNINRGKNRTWRGRPTSSGYKGVSWSNKRKKWHSYIWFDNKRMHLGYFTEDKDAARAYDAMVYELHGEYAYLNFPRLRLAA